MVRSGGDRPGDLAAPAGRLDDPVVAFVTMQKWGPVYWRIARWLSAGMREIDARADIVYLDGSPGLMECAGRVRDIHLGASKASRSLPRLARYLRAARPAMTLVTPGPVALLASISGRFVDTDIVPWEATIPSLDKHDKSLGLRCSLVVSRVAYRRCVNVATVSEGVRAALADELGPSMPSERLVVIPNPVHADEIRQRSRPTAERTGRLRLCSVGRLVWSKGFDVLIEALALADLGDAWELLIIGDGPKRRSLEALVACRGLEDHVKFLGWLANPYPIMASADMAVLASRWEGFGMVISEAMALGLPQIATDCPGGVRESMGGGEYGVLVPPEDPVALADALQRLADDPHLRARLGEAGAEHVARYAPGLVAERIVQLARGTRDRAAAMQPTDLRS